MSRGLGSLLFRLGADIKDFQTGLKQAEGELSKFSYKAQRIGRDLTTSITLPLLAIGAKSVMAFDKQAKAVAQVEAGIASTGMAAGLTSTELQKMASDLQKITTYGDEQILREATANLLTFTNVTKNEFPKAQKAILDISARMGTDLRSSAIMVGKALNDPILGLTALRRVGIQFTKDQENVIKSLVNTGDVAGAQQAILEELERQFGGSAEAMVAGLGGVQQMWNAIGDASETVGKLIIPYIERMASRVKTLAEGFAGLNEGTQKFVIIAAGIAASIGPGLLAINQLIKVKRALVSTIAILRAALIKLTATMLANPYTAIAVALGAVAGALFLFRKRTHEAETAQWKLGDAIKEVNSLIGEQIWTTLVNRVETMADGTRKLTTDLSLLGASVKKLTREELSSLKLFLEDELANAFRESESNAEDFGGIMGQVASGQVAQLQEAITLVDGELSNFKTTIESTGSSAALAGGLIGTLGDRIKDLNKQLGTAGSEEAIAALNDQIQELEDELTRLRNLSGLALTQLNENALISLERMQSLTGVIATGVTPALDGMKASADGAGDSVAAMGEGAIPMVEQLQYTFASLGDTFAQAFAQFVTGAGTIKSGMGMMLSIVGDGMQQLGRLFLSAGIAATAFWQSLSNPAAAPFAIVAGLALIAAGTAVKQFSSKGFDVPGMAEGGIVPQGFPNDSYMARLTSGEIVVPPEKLDKIMGKGLDNIAVHVFLKSKLVGSDLLLVVEKAQASRKRNIGR